MQSHPHSGFWLGWARVVGDWFPGGPAVTWGTLPSSAAPGARFNLAASLELVLTVGHNDVTGRYAVCDIGKILLSERNGNRRYVDGFILLHHEYIRALRPPLDGCCRYDGAVLAHFQQQPDVHELVGPKLAVFIFEYRFQFAGSRSRIDLVVDRLQLASCEFGLIVATVNVHGERTLLHMLRYRREIVFRKREQHRNGLKLRNHKHGIRIGCVDDIAWINLPKANLAADGSRDMAIR